MIKLNEHFYLHLFKLPRADLSWNRYIWTLLYRFGEKILTYFSDIQYKTEMKRPEETILS